jgi:hypothetical protein
MTKKCRQVSFFVEPAGRVRKKWYEYRELMIYRLPIRCEVILLRFNLNSHLGSDGKSQLVLTGTNWS